jgi:hypothetical protein
MENIVDSFEKDCSKRIGIAKGKLGPIMSWEEWQDLDEEFENMIAEAIEDKI